MAKEKQEETSLNQEPNQTVATAVASPFKLTFSLRMVFTIFLFALVFGLAVGYFYGRNLNPQTGESSPAVPIVTENGQPVTQPTATSEPDPTADWETYTNEEYGFSAKYPTSWTFLERPSTGNPNELISFYVRFYKGNQTDNNSPLSETYLSISIYGNPTNLTLEDWLSKKPGIGKTSDYLLGGQKALKVQSTSGVGKESEAIYCEENTNIFQVASIVMGDSDAATLATLDKILSTFRFD